MAFYAAIDGAAGTKSRYALTFSGARGVAFIMGRIIAFMAIVGVVFLIGMVIGRRGGR